MNNISRLAITSILATTLSGCIIVGGDHDEFQREVSRSDWQDIEQNNRKAIANLTLGEQYAAIQGRLGEPSFSEAFQMGDSSYQVLYYRTHRSHSDGETTKDETTALVFNDKSLIGWGDEALARVR